MKTIIDYILGATFAALVALSVSVAVAGTSSVSGSFKGASKHVTTGGVSIEKTADGATTVVLGKDFSLDGAPDPRVGFGNNGKFASSTDLGKLVKLNGRQTYVVPANIDASKFNEVYIWCRKFNVPLGVAKLN